jgi:hypothetical protein
MHDEWVKGRRLFGVGRSVVCIASVAKVDFASIESPSYCQLLKNAQDRSRFIGEEIARHLTSTSTNGPET